MKLPVFYLHGLFGDPEDFDAMRGIFPGQVLHIPGHRGWEESLSSIDVIEKLHQKLIPSSPCILIGYSLGGRLALMLHDRYPSLFSKIICISSHLGVQTDQERIERKRWEDEWMELFVKEPKETVFKKWYDQPLFNSFRAHASFEEVLKRRQECDLSQIALVFDATRRSKMKCELPSKEKALFLVGEKDESLLKHYGASLTNERYAIVKNAGHCLHIENPITCCDQIRLWLEEKR